jgi:hypothetical protein
MIEKKGGEIPHPVLFVYTDRPDDVIREITAKWPGGRYQRRQVFRGTANPPLNIILPATVQGHVRTT